MSEKIIEIINSLDKSSLNDIGAEIEFHEFKIRGLKRLWDEEYSRLCRVALAQSTGGSS